MDKSDFFARVRSDQRARDRSCAITILYNLTDDLDEAVGLLECVGPRTFIRTVSRLTDRLQGRPDDLRRAVRSLEDWS
jgi:hypothetical protein